MFDFGALLTTAMKSKSTSISIS